MVIAQSPRLAGVLKEGSSSSLASNLTENKIQTGVDVVVGRIHRTPMTQRWLSPLSPTILMDLHGSFWFRHLSKILLAAGCIIFYCEVLIYYMVLLQCTWPLLDSATQENGIRQDNPNASPLKVFNRRSSLIIRLC